MSDNFPKNAKLLTIGCRLNQADSALLIGRLASNGCKVLEQDSKICPELVIVNSCTVTAKADSKSRQAARKLRREYPDARIIVTGCGAELVGKEQNKADSAVDLWLPNPEKSRIISHIIRLFTGKEPVAEMCLSEEMTTDDFQEEATAAFPFKSRAFLKIQEGCDNFCSYCIVPHVRGRERSRKHVEVVSEFNNLLEKGFCEIVLTGVNVCAYNSSDVDLAKLLTELTAIDGDFRIRLSSTEPHPNNQHLLDVMAKSPKICRFLHLSLQHGSDAILRAMNRKYTIKEYTEFVEAAREKIPGIHIGTDIIVGFPGETDTDYANELKLLKKLKFANVHLFTYSKRKGTPAAEMPNQIASEVVAERFSSLKKIADQTKLDFAKEHIGKPLQVLFERKRKNGLLKGWSDNYLAVLAPENKAELNQLMTVIPTLIDNNGELIVET